MSWPICSKTMLAEIGDISRFGSARKLLTRAWRLPGQVQADAGTPSRRPS